MKSTTNELWKGWNLTWYHHSTHIDVLKSRDGYGKTGCISCINWTIYFEVWGFQTKTHLLQRHFIFQTYFNSRLFVHLICTIQSHILKFQPFLTSFAIFHAFNDLFWAKWPWNWKAVQMNSEKVVTWHDIIISPT